MKAGQRSKARVMLYLLHSGNFYGTERMALATLEGMTEYDKRVVFAPKPYGVGSVVAEALAAGFEAVNFTTRANLGRKLLPWFLRYRSIDVIGTGSAQSYICHVLAKVMFVRLRQIQVVHGGTEDAQAYARKQALNRIPVRVVAVSRFVEDKLVQHGVRPGMISVIENFVSDAQFRDGGRRQSYDGSGSLVRRIDPGRVRVAVVSRLDPIKKVNLLLQAIEADGLDEFQFDVYGTGSDFDALSKRGATLKNLRLHGFVPDVGARLVEADFLLHFCDEEPFGLVILEAFVSGVVAIVPDAGGAGDLVRNDVTGSKFTANDVGSLVATLRRTASLPAATLQRMADAARQRVLERFSQQEGIQRYRQALQASVG